MAKDGDLLPQKRSKVGGKFSRLIIFTRYSLTTPIFEYHYIISEIYLDFLKELLPSIQDFSYPSKTSGLGIEIDESKVKEEQDINHVL